MWSGCVPSSSSVHRAHGKKATIPIYKVLVRPGRKANSRPTSTEADALTARPRAGLELFLLRRWTSRVPFAMLRGAAS